MAATEVRTLDRRTLVSTGNTGDQPVAAGEGSRVLLAWYVQWRITDPLHYLQQMGNTVDAGAVRLNATLRAALQDDLENVTLTCLPIHMACRTPLRVGSMRCTYRRASRGDWRCSMCVRRASAWISRRPRRRMRMREALQQMAGMLKEDAASVAGAAHVPKPMPSVTLCLLKAGVRRSRSGAKVTEAIRIYAQDYAKDPRFASFFRSLAVYRKSSTRKAISW